ncbi:hypothetical protein GGH92_003760 [Coemansia sp. RSA 2673]|nr:hypothetical protein GGH92_003760 [Coemansia sp. RSA 2673]
MISNGPAYVSFIAVIVFLVCLGAWLRRRRIQAAMMQRDQMELESRLNTGRNNTTWDDSNGPLQPAHAHLRQHRYSVDTKPDEYLPPYSQPITSQPPPYASTSMTNSPTHLRT